jgi:hypothetical protein
VRESSLERSERSMAACSISCLKSGAKKLASFMLTSSEFSAMAMSTLESGWMKAYSQASRDSSSANLAATGTLNKFLSY